MSALAALSRSVLTRPPTVEQMLTLPQFCGLATATPLQRAICRIIDGLPLDELASHDHVRAALGFGTAPEGKPLEILLLAGVRTGKSLLAAIVSVRASLTVDLSPTLGGGGEVPRYSVISLEKDNARDVMRHLSALLSKPVFRDVRVSPGQSDDAWVALLRRTGAELVGSEFLRHPTGRVVEIRVVAGKRAGGSIVSKWSTGLCQDEAPRMNGAADGVVSLDENRDAVLARLLPGAQHLMIGSPWRAYGPAYELHRQHYSRPSRDIVVVQARGPWLNPVWWTPARCEAMKSNPTVYSRDVEAQFMSGSEQFFDEPILQRATPSGVEAIEPDHRVDYVAGMDAATRTNRWTLVVIGKYGNVLRMVQALEWSGRHDAPLSSRAVLRDIAATLVRYNLTWVWCDHWAVDPLQDIADDLYGSEPGEYHGPQSLTLSPVTTKREERVEAATKCATAMNEGRFTLLDMPNLQRDFRQVVRSASMSGFDVTYRKTSDGRHADFVPATFLALRSELADIDLSPDPGTPEALEEWDRQAEAREIVQVQERVRKKRGRDVY